MVEGLRMFGKSKEKMSNEKMPGQEKTGEEIMQNARTERAGHFAEIMDRLKDVASRIVDMSPIGSAKIIVESILGKTLVGGSVGKSRMIHGIVGITGLMSYLGAFLEARGTMPGAGPLGAVSMGTSYTLYFANMDGAVDKFRAGLDAAADAARNIGQIEPMPMLDVMQIIAEHYPEEVAQALRDIGQISHA